MPQQEAGQFCGFQNLDRLTPREQEILLRLMEGRSNKGIAHTLIISPRTVQKHLERIYAKLGVRSRTALVLMIVQNKLLNKEVYEASGSVEVERAAVTEGTN